MYNDILLFIMKKEQASSRLLNPRYSISHVVNNIQDFPDSPILNLIPTAYFTKSRSSLIQSRTNKTEDMDFKPKNVIFCLSLRKIYLENSRRYKKFSFCLIRSLYKEWKIKTSPSPKRKPYIHYRNSSKSLLNKKKYSKDKENMMIHMIRNNKARLLKNRFFYSWQKAFKEKQYYKLDSAKKISHVISRVLSKIFRRVVVNIEDIMEEQKTFEDFTSKFAKSLMLKIIKIIISNSHVQNNATFKHFSMMIRPRHVFPIIINGLKKNEISSITIQKINNSPQVSRYRFSQLKLEKYRIGLQKLFRSNIDNRYSLRCSMSTFRNFSQNKKRILQKFKSITVIFSFVSQKTQEYKQSFLRNLERSAIVSLRIHQSVDNLTRLIKSITHKQKIYGIFKIFLHFQHIKNTKAIWKGLIIVSRLLKYKILNNLYHGLIVIKNSRQTKGYKSIIKESIGTINSLGKTLQSIKKKRKLFALVSLQNYSKCIKYLENFSNLYTLLKSIFNKSSFKFKLSSLNAIMNYRPQPKRSFLKYINVEYLFKRIYIKKLAYAFM